MNEESIKLAKECGLPTYSTQAREKVLAFAALIRDQDLARIAELEEALTAIADPDSNHQEIIKFMHSAGACLERVYEDIAEKALANKSSWLASHGKQRR